MGGAPANPAQDAHVLPEPQISMRKEPPGLETEKLTSKEKERERVCVLKTKHLPNAYRRKCIIKTQPAAVFLHRPLDRLTPKLRTRTHALQQLLIF